jgi:hypothetical protein
MFRLLGAVYRNTDEQTTCPYVAYIRHGDDCSSSSIDSHDEWEYYEGDRFVGVVTWFDIGKEKNLRTLCMAIFEQM